MYACSSADNGSSLVETKIQHVLSDDEWLGHEDASYEDVNLTIHVKESYIR